MVEVETVMSQICYGCEMLPLPIDCLRKFCSLI